MKARTMGLAVAMLAMSASTATAEATYAPGLEAEIYVVGRVGEVRDLPVRPSGVPLGVIVDRNAPLMDYNVFQRDASMAGYHGQNILGVLWKGYLDIKEQGIHIISISDFKYSWRDGCVARSWINGNEALGVAYMDRNMQQTYTDQNAFDLSPGFYEINFWKTCISDERNSVIRNDTLERARLTFSMKAPSQTAIAPVDSSLLVHQVR